MKTWEELTELEQIACLFSDLHKDVHGFRPRANEIYADWTVEDYKREMEYLEKALEIVIAEEKVREQEAIVKFERRIENLVHGDITRERVISWLMDAEGVQGDFDYFCFLNGLPYGYFKEVA